MIQVEMDVRRTKFTSRSSTRQISQPLINVPPSGIQPRISSPRGDREGLLWFCQESDPHTNKETYG